ncbi:MAG TPA: DUF736 domain-containing protein [Stellaceae bacterium]|jgi:uncharacterized protein (DUF736 family)|nr:DUF736 domain-containing protein [Stellaceae bacterium]
MAITLGTFTKSDAGFVGTLRTLNAAAALAIVPVDKTSDNGPDYRVYAGQRRYEIGAGWSQVAKSSGETYVNLKIAAPEFGPNWLRCRLVKLEHPAGRGRRHPHRTVGAARPLTATPRRGSSRRGFPFSERKIPYLMFGTARRARLFSCP